MKTQHPSPVRYPVPFILEANITTFSPHPLGVPVAEFWSLSVNGGLVAPISKTLRQADLI